MGSGGSKGKKKISVTFKSKHKSSKRRNVPTEEDQAKFRTMAQGALDDFIKGTKLFPADSFPSETIETVKQTFYAQKLVKTAEPPVERRGSIWGKTPSAEKIPLQTLQLVFDKCNLKDMGCTALAHCIKQGHPITHFYLRNDKCSVDGALSLGKSLRKNDELLKLDLSGCPLGDAGIKALLKYFPDNVELKELVLNATKAKDGGALLLASSLLQHEAFERVEIGNNFIGDVGNEALIRCLMVTTQMTKFTLDADKVSDSDLVESLTFTVDRNRLVYDIIDELLDKCTDWDTILKCRLDKQPSASKDKFSPKLNSSLAFQPAPCLGPNANMNGRKFSFGMADMCGRRVEMQDVMWSKVNFRGKDDEHIFGVFDGHGGTECARFVGHHFPLLLEKFLQDESISVEDALRKVFDTLNEWCVNYGIPHGSCAVVSYFKADKIYTACVGDSRSILARRSVLGGAISPGSVDRTTKSGTAKLIPECLSPVLKPLDPEESGRIKDLGGFVSKNGRVLGVLAVSRALGDVQFHPYVTHIPMITTVDLDDTVRAVCLACDGVWDVFTQQEVVDLVHTWTDPIVAAAMIRDASFIRGSQDNISVLVVKLGD